MPAAATLNGTVNDDGLPNPPGTVTTTWSQVSGPGTTTFGNVNSPSTTATFSAAGSYVLRLTGNDGQLQASDDVSVVVGTGSGGSTVLDVPVRAGSDDAEERSASTSVTGGDMELVVDGTSVQTDGLRFTGVTVPPGATITNAYVQFQADEAGSVATNLTIVGQAADESARLHHGGGGRLRPAEDGRGRRVGSRRLVERCARRGPADAEPGSRRAGDRLADRLGERQRAGARGDRLRHPHRRDVRGRHGQGARPAHRVRLGRPDQRRAGRERGPRRRGDPAGRGDPVRVGDRRRTAEPAGRGDRGVVEGDRPRHGGVRGRERRVDDRDVHRGGELRAPADR